MATIKDVAKEAGVSIGTVSNYLNQKTNVSEKTAQKISDAIQKLNYVVQNSGRELRKGKNNVLGLIFPNISEPYFEKIISSIKGYMNLHSSRYFIDITLTDHNPQREINAIMNYVGRNISGMIIYSCQPQNIEIFRVLEKSNIPYVLLDRRPHRLDCNFVYMDNYTLFYYLTKSYCLLGYRDIALVIGSREFDENFYAFQGYQAAMEEFGRSVNPKYVYTCIPIRENGFRAGVYFHQENKQIPNVILTTSYRVAEGLRYAYVFYHYDTEKDIKIISTGDSLHDVFYFDRGIYKTPRSAYEMGEKASQLLLENIKSPVVFEKQHFCIQDNFQELRIFSPAEQHLQREQFVFKERIRALLLDDENAISGISSLLGHFYQKTGIEVDIVKILPENIFEFIQEYKKSGRDDIDVFLLDVPWLSYFAENDYLVCLDEFVEVQGIDEENFIPGILNSYGRYQGKLYALPFMVCTQLLFYRSDLFKDEYLCRKFEEQNMVPLEPPTSWLQYNTIAKFFCKNYNPGSPVEYGHSISLSYPEELICNLMPRLWEQKADLYSMDGHIKCNTRQVRKAIHNLLESVRYADPETLSNRPIHTLHNFIEGRTAMVSVYYNYATEIQNKLQSKVIDRVGYVQLPGDSVLSGWSLALSSNTKKAEAAFAFIRWATGMEVAVPHTILGGQSPNVSVYQNYDMLALYPWFTKALNELKSSRPRRSPISAKGTLLNEKKVEDIVFRHVSPLIQDSVSGIFVDTDRIDAMLCNLQKELLRL